MKEQSRLFREAVWCQGKTQSGKALSNQFKLRADAIQRMKLDEMLSLDPFKHAHL